MEEQGQGSGPTPISAVSKGVGVDEGQEVNIGPKDLVEPIKEHELNAHQNKDTHRKLKVERTLPIKLGHGAPDIQNDFQTFPPKKVAQDMIAAMKRPGDPQPIRQSKRPKLSKPGVGLGFETSER